MIDFSLNLLCKERLHLISTTLDSLKFQKGNFEVLILDGEESGKLGEIGSNYPDLKVRIEGVSGRTTAEMMNLGLKLSNGKYVQFIEPGDRYISQQALSFLSEWIDQHGEPDFVYANSLIQGEVLGEEASKSHFPWFLRAKALNLGGFSGHLELRPVFDFVCKLTQDGTIKGLFCPRVFIDPAPRKMGARYMRETWNILRRRYGFWPAIKWIFTHDHKELFNRFLTATKKAFSKQD